jgi:hypothetical protein
MLFMPVLFLSPLRFFGPPVPPDSSIAHLTAYRLPPLHLDALLSVATYFVR